MRTLSSIESAATTRTSASTLVLRERASGSHRAALSGFLRRSDQLIQLLLRPDTAARYQNFRSARNTGLEASAGWTTPGRYVELDASVSYVDARLVSAGGAFAALNGDRLPNQPWLFAAISARAQREDALASKDELSMGWTTCYLHRHYYGWSREGSEKAEIPSHLQHTLLLSYLLRAAAELSFNAEIQNITDARLYDYLGLPKLGRAFFSRLAVGY